MFNFFKKKKEKANEQDAFAIAPEWVKTVTETQDRLFVFLDKLEERMKELAEAAIPELKAMKREDERDFGNMMNGVLGQLASVQEKASATYEEKVEDLYYDLSDKIEIDNPHHSFLSNFRHNCSERYHKIFEEKLNQYRNDIQKIAETDYEVVYQAILDEHEKIKNTFKCMQCGSIIPLTKIYFITTHIACPFCQTKNTFHPSTLASGLEQVGRGLAEQRTQHLLDKYNLELERERELYHQGHLHKLKVGTNPSAELQQKIAALEQERKASESLAPTLYSAYQRAMFDEWKKLVPDLAEQTENFYQGLQKKNF